MFLSGSLLTSALTKRVCKRELDMVKVNSFELLQIIVFAGVSITLSPFQNGNSLPHE